MITEEELRREYIDNELSIIDCADVLNSSVYYIRKLLEEYNIPKRSKTSKTKTRLEKLSKNKNIGSKTASYYQKIKETGEVPENELKRREKISEWSSEFKKSEEHKSKIGKALVGNTNAADRVVSEETRKKISDALKKRIAEKGKLSSGMTGHSHSEDTKKKLSEGQIKKLQDKFYLGKMTKLEKKGYAKLDEAGFEYEPQKQIDYYLVDAYIPEYNTIVEFQGQYWHSRDDIKSKDEAKRKFFKQKGYKLVEVWEQDIDTWNPESIME